MARRELLVEEERASVFGVPTEPPAPRATTHERNAVHAWPMLQEIAATIVIPRFDKGRCRQGRGGGVFWIKPFAARQFLPRRPEFGGNDVLFHSGTPSKRR